METPLNRLWNRIRKGSAPSVKQPVVGDYVIHPSIDNKILVIQDIDLEKQVYTTSFGDFPIMECQYVAKSVVKVIVEEQEGIGYNGWVSLL